MQTKESQQRQKKRTVGKNARRSRKHILSGARLPSQLSGTTSNNRLKRQPAPTIVNLNSKPSITPLVIARLQDEHPVYGENSRIQFLEHVYECLSNNSNWKDTHEWNDGADHKTVIETLTKDLENLLPKNATLNFDPESNKFHCYHEYIQDGCMIPVSCFLPQLKEFNPPLYNMVATTISHISTRCGFALWDSDIDHDGLYYAEEMLSDPSYHELDDQTLQKYKDEVDRWNNVIIPYAKEIRELSKKTTIETIIDEVNNFDWPNNFTAKRMFLWFHKAFKLILSDFHVNSFTHIDPAEHEDGPPLLPEDTFKFSWPSLQDSSMDGVVNTNITEYLNDRFGNFGCINLSKKLEFVKGWENITYSFKELFEFCDATISLWLEPEFRDFYRIAPVTTYKSLEPQRYGPPKKCFKPVSWKPKKCNL